VVVAHVGDVNLVLVARQLSRSVLGDDQACDDQGIGGCCAQRDRRVARSTVVRGARVFWVVGVCTRCADGPATRIGASPRRRDFNVGGGRRAGVGKVPDFGAVFGVVVVKVVGCIERDKVVDRIPCDACDGPVRFCQVKDGHDGDENCIVGMGGVFPRPRLQVVLVR
jgi:hypothetical protein